MRTSDKFSEMSPHSSNEELEATCSLSTSPASSATSDCSTGGCSMMEMVMGDAQAGHGQLQAHGQDQLHPAAEGHTPDTARKKQQQVEGGGTAGKKGGNGSSRGGSGGRRRFVGVRQRPSGRWVAEIKDSNQRIRLWLGTFDNAEDAARAYDDAARALRGAHTRTNFALPDSAAAGAGVVLPSKAAARILLQRVQAAAVAQAAQGRHVPPPAMHHQQHQQQQQQQQQQQSGHGQGAAMNLFRKVVAAATNSSDLSAATTADSEESCASYRNRQLELGSPQSVLLDQQQQQYPGPVPAAASLSYQGGGVGRASRAAGETGIYDALREKLNRALKGSGARLTAEDHGQYHSHTMHHQQHAQHVPGQANSATTERYGGAPAAAGNCNARWPGAASDSSQLQAAPPSHSYSAGFQAPSTGTASDMCGLASSTASCADDPLSLANAGLGMAASSPLLHHHHAHLHSYTNQHHHPAVLDLHSARMAAVDGTAMHGCTTTSSGGPGAPSPPHFHHLFHPLQPASSTSTRDPHHYLMAAADGPPPPSASSRLITTAAGSLTSAAISPSFNASLFTTTTTGPGTSCAVPLSTHLTHAHHHSLCDIEPVALPAASSACSSTPPAAPDAAAAHCFDHDAAAHIFQACSSASSTTGTTHAGAGIGMAPPAAAAESLTPASAFASPSWNVAAYTSPKLLYSFSGELMPVGEAAGQDAFWSSLWTDQSPQVCAPVA